jgi:hypothetical protein
MVNLNRIGNKLGLAGVLGVLLSAGMVVNQMVTDAAVRAADQRAEAQQLITDHALEADVGMRRMQLAVRDVRLSKNPSEAEKGFGDLTAAHATAAKELDIALGHVTKLQNSKTLRSRYLRSSRSGMMFPPVGPHYSKRNLPHQL